MVVDKFVLAVSVWMGVIVLGGLIVIGHHIDHRRSLKHFGTYKEEPGVISTWWKAKREKYCIQITFTEG